MPHRKHSFRTRATIALGVVAVGCAVLASSALAVYPNSMSATGDSITRAFNSCSPAFTDCPANSWATGTNASVNSFYNRILAANPAIRGNAFNDAVSGARMSSLPGQTTTAAGHRVEYVTIEMGANDVCTSSEATMTSVANFRRDFETSINNLRTRLPSARISVGSIPDVYWLWSLFTADRTATSTWNALRVCQSMLANPTSRARADEDRRRNVQQRSIDFNRVLSDVCATYTQCKFDRNIAFNYHFRTSEVSTNDYFHPSLTGQTTIASIEWGQTWVF
ncbi:MAG TPA: SGNH/GDSL hydrolase family protein [Thermoleophilaceae bacterium]